MNMQEILNEASVKLYSSEERDYLGGSVIGRPCSREKWYGFRWCGNVEFEPRMLRLFALGHKIEDDVVKLLEAGGIHVDNTDANGKQHGFIDLHGHFRGSCDGILKFDDEEALLEVKSHNAKSFKKVSEQGVAVAKIEHYVQMQVYMYYLGINIGLYFAVNKDNSDIYTEWVRYNQSAAEFAKANAKEIILSKTPPAPFSESRDGMTCRFCNYKDICEGVKPFRKNCRTCIHSSPAKNAEWGCRLKGEIITEDVIKCGCENYKAIKND